MYWSRGTQTFLHRSFLIPMYLCLERLAISAENGYIWPKSAYIVTLLLVMLDTWVWCLTPGFWVWKIIWGHFQEPQMGLKVKNRVEGLYEAKDNFKEWFCNFGSEHTRDLILMSQQMFLGSRNHLGSYSRASEVSKGQEQCGGAVRGQEQHQGVK